MTSAEEERAADQFFTPTLPAHILDQDETRSFHFNPCCPTEADMHIHSWFTCRSLLLGGILCAGWCAIGCPGDTPAEMTEQTSCTPGARSACLCGSGFNESGFRTCDPTGTQWGPCDCGGEGAAEGEGEGGLGEGEGGTSEGQAEGEGEGLEGEGADGEGATGEGEGVEGEGEGRVTPGEFKAPCEQQVDCRSGWCVDSDEGRVCSRVCNDDCPDGWRCRSVSNVGGDLIYICQPNRSNLCQPCDRDDNCLGDGSRCIIVGQGMYCGRECTIDYPCPAGFLCQDVYSVEGLPQGKQCKPADGTCGYCEDNDGDRYGTGPDCLGDDCVDSDVSIYEGAPELCDGKDNNCNFQVDELPQPPVEPLDCPTQGVCLDVQPECRDGRWQCRLPAGYQPTEVSCDSLDNDCDGQVDEELSQDCSTACGQGTERCLGGRWVNCTAPMPQPEVCGDGIDNMCAGIVDRGQPDAWEINGRNEGCGTCSDLGTDPDVVLTPTFDHLTDDRYDYFCFEGDDNASAPWDLEEIKVELQSLPPGLVVNLALYESIDLCARGNAMEQANGCVGPCSLSWREPANLDNNDSRYVIKVERVGNFFDCLAQYRLRVTGLR